MIVSDFEEELWSFNDEGHLVQSLVTHSVRSELKKVCQKIDVKMVISPKLRLF